MRLNKVVPNGCGTVWLPLWQLSRPRDRLTNPPGSAPLGADHRKPEPDLAIPLLRDHSGRSQTGTDRLDQRVRPGVSGDSVTHLVHDVAEAHLMVEISEGQGTAGSRVSE